MFSATRKSPEKRITVTAVIITSARNAIKGSACWKARTIRRNMIRIPDVSRFSKKALRSTVVKAKVVAVAFTPAGHVITSATNTRVDGDFRRYSFHAEYLLLRKLEKMRVLSRYRNVLVLVARYSLGEWKMAKPCGKCSLLLKLAGLSEVFYTYNGNILKM